MKYIKTKDEIFEYNPLLNVSVYKDAIEEADSIEELIDEKVLIEKDGNPTLLEEVDFDRNIYLRINEYEFATQLPNNPIIYGSIWIYNNDGVPTLKPVAKMKGVLPNGEIDWELL